MFSACHRHPFAAAWSALLLCWLPACNKQQAATNLVPGPAANSTAVEPKEILISAAASTKELIEALASEYAKSEPVVIKLNPGPTSSLANQIIEGAPAELFLSASREWAEKVVAADPAAKTKELLTSKLVLIVPKRNPAEIREPQDLLSDKVKTVALAGENVPAGKYADQVLNKLGLREKLNAAGKIARGQDVRGALSFVEQGEAEAGIVYSTDVVVARNVEVVHEFDPKLHDEIVYVLVLLKDGALNPAAVDFFDYLQSAATQPIYSQTGFTRIPESQP